MLPKFLKLIFIIAFSLYISSCQRYVPEEPGSEALDLNTARNGLTKLHPTDGLVFSRACESGKKITIAAVGDVLLHQPLQSQGAKQKSGMRYKSLWKDFIPVFKNADFAYANLEGPTASDYAKDEQRFAINSAIKSVQDPGIIFDKNVYTSYPQFNYPAAVIDDLKESGIDVVSTANNHAMDRRSIGAEYTIHALKKRNLSFTGTRLNKTDNWYTVTEKDGVRIAWLACSFSTNGLPDPYNQVLMCFNGSQPNPTVISIVKELYANKTINAILFTPHWGQEYHHEPEKKQITLAHAVLDAGATAVLGSHPHVLQPWEKYVSNSHEKFAIYSLGNFVSGQPKDSQKTSAAVILGLTIPETENRKAFVNGARYIPIFMKNGNWNAHAISIKEEPKNKESMNIIHMLFGKPQKLQLSAALNTTPQCK